MNPGQAGEPSEKQEQRAARDEFWEMMKTHSLVSHALHDAGGKYRRHG
jgi:hypothetical protein